jgi:hypothetical protein
MRAFSGVALPAIVTMLALLVRTSGAAGASGAATAFDYNIHLPPGKFVSVAYQGASTPSRPSR